MFCHSRAAGFVLGLNTRQMNRDQDYGGVVDNQLRALDHIGIFRDRLPQPPAAYPAFSDPFDKAKADLTTRAKTYLDVNCAMCHVEDGGGNSLIVLNFDAKLEGMRMLDVRPLQDNLGIADARLIAPGDPERSVILGRVARRGTYQMPPTSSNVVDSRAVDLLQEWITQLKPQGKPADSASD